MKKLVLTFGIVALSFLTVQATTLNELSNYKTETAEVTSVYIWNVITANGTFSGSSMSLDHAKQMVKLSSAGDIIVEQKIVKHYLLKEDFNKKYFYWEVESTKAKASGFSSSEAKARKLINLVAKGDIINYKIIVNKKY